MNYTVPPGGLHLWEPTPPYALGPQDRFGLQQLDLHMPHHSLNGLDMAGVTVIIQPSETR